MAWIRTVPLDQMDDEMLKLLTDLRTSYPPEYEEPTSDVTNTDESIIMSHTLIPDAMFHAFSEFSVLMSPDLPLKRRQHEMIATMVSKTNDCFY